ncbi:hypothetical protein NEHOM01_0224 [Nematocida homosporus]|uniref:uncharacterized protein n=1 Tax=Nematocida homosporus TaxID=1912981 RepID=UPI00221F3145|nr:uncharacterized protein NEHOM01_0224 [Nematocida homosporus]KAI5184549.1 hypothetical protein NEHOM01_0224 [Nematocida homosporus]
MKYEIRLKTVLCILVVLSYLVDSLNATSETDCHPNKAHDNNNAADGETEDTNVKPRFEYKDIKLANKLKTVLISSAQHKFIGFSLAIGVGIAHAPSEFPEIVHLIAAVIQKHSFASSDVPKDSLLSYRYCIDRFMRRLGGWFNVSIRRERTVMTLVAPESMFELAINKFVRLFREHSIGAKGWTAEEIDAQRDLLLKQFGYTVKRMPYQEEVLVDHLTSQEILYNRPKDKYATRLKDSVPLKHLEAFWQRYFQTNNMHLTLFGYNGLDQLGRLARKYFAGPFEVGKTACPAAWCVYDLVEGKAKNPLISYTRHGLYETISSNTIVLYRLESNVSMETEKLVVHIPLPSSFYTSTESMFAYIANLFNHSNIMIGLNNDLITYQVSYQECRVVLQRAATVLRIETYFSAIVSSVDQIKKVCDIIYQKFMLAARYCTANNYYEFQKTRIIDIPVNKENIPSAQLLEKVAFGYPWYTLYEVLNGCSSKPHNITQEDLKRTMGMVVQVWSWLVMFQTITPLPSNYKHLDIPYCSISYAVLPYTCDLEFTPQSQLAIDQLKDVVPNDALTQNSIVDIAVSREEKATTNQLGSIPINVVPYIHLDLYKEGRKQMTFTKEQNGVTACLVYSTSCISSLSQVEIILESPEFDKNLDSFVHIRLLMELFRKHFNTSFTIELTLSRCQIKDIYHRPRQIIVVFSGVPTLIHHMIDLFLRQLCQFSIANAGISLEQLKESLRGIIAEHTATPSSNLCEEFGVFKSIGNYDFDVIANGNCVVNPDLNYSFPSKDLCISMLAFGNNTRNEFDAMVDMLQEYSIPNVDADASKVKMRQHEVYMEVQKETKDAAIFAHNVRKFPYLKNIAIACIIKARGHTIHKVWLGGPFPKNTTTRVGLWVRPSNKVYLYFRISNIKKSDEDKVRQMQVKWLGVFYKDLFTVTSEQFEMDRERALQMLTIQFNRRLCCVQPENYLNPIFQDWSNDYISKFARLEEEIKKVTVEMLKDYLKNSIENWRVCFTTKTKILPPPMTYSSSITAMLKDIASTPSAPQPDDKDEDTPSLNALSLKQSKSNELNADPKRDWPFIPNEQSKRKPNTRSSQNNRSNSNNQRSQSSQNNRSNSNSQRSQPPQSNYSNSNSQRSQPSQSNNYNSTNQRSQSTQTTPSNLNASSAQPQPNANNQCAQPNQPHDLANQPPHSNQVSYDSQTDQVSLRPQYGQSKLKELSLEDQPRRSINPDSSYSNTLRQQNSRSNSRRHKPYSKRHS